MKNGENKMNYFNQQYARIRKTLITALVVGCAFATVNQAAAQRVTPPPTSTDITVPIGNTAFLVGHAFGSQGYTCLPTATGGTAWNPTARPEATLFTNFFGKQIQIITHFASVYSHPNDVAVKLFSLSRNATFPS